jgi:hypothetical protein
VKLDELIKSERARAGFSKDERAALWKGIAQGVSALQAPGQPSASRPQTPASPATSAAPALGSWKLGALLAASLVGGAAVGAAAHARWSSPRTVYVDRQEPVALASVPGPAAAATASAPSASASPTDPAAQSPRLPSGTPPSARERLPAPRPPLPPASAPARDAPLERERTLLDMSRTALARGDAAAALASLDTHAREFPRGQLAEEREVMTIQALVATRRLSEARQRAAAFRTTYPASALLPVIDEAVQ